MCNGVTNVRTFYWSERTEGDGAGRANCGAGRTVFRKGKATLDPFVFACWQVSTNVLCPTILVYFLSIVLSQHHLLSTHKPKVKEHLSSARFTDSRFNDYEQQTRGKRLI